MNLTKSRYVGLLLASTSALTFNVAMAQDADNDQEIEEVVVTGSHIRRSGFDGRAPISVVDSQTIAEIGASQPVDVLKTLTANSGSQMYGETNSMRGAAQFNIRGLGLGSSLTLLNGRRTGVAPMANASGSEFVDINQFPLLMIERIEVLADGASATYGSQAVAGVANIITRKGFEGFEVSADFRTSANKAGSINMAMGHAFDKGHFNMYASHYRQTRQDRTDLPWLVERIHGDGDLKSSRLISSTGSPGTYFLGVPNADGVLARTGTAFPDPDCEAALGVLRTPTDSRCRYDFADQVSVISAEDRTQVFTEMDWEFNDSIRWYNESHFSRNVVRRSGGGSTLNTGNAANGSNKIVPGSHPFNFFVQAMDDEGNPTTALEYIGPAAWDNDVHTAVDIVAIMRPIGTEANGPNRESFMDEFGFDDLDVYSNRTYLRVMNGFEAQLPNNWIGDVSYSYSDATNNYDSNFNYRSDVFLQMIADGDWNPFGSAKATPGLVSPKDGVSVAGNTPLDFKQFAGRSVSRTTVSEHVVDAVANGDLAEIDGGTIGGAVGFQYRRVQMNSHPNSLSAAGEANESSKSFSVYGVQDVIAVFGETVIPFSDWGELQMAVRREDYGGTIGSTTDPKISFEVRPNDTFGIRGSWGTSFQAPTVRQTATASSSAFIDDPASAGAGPSNAVCVNAGNNNNIVVSVQGSPLLKPQSAKNWNLGFTANSGGFRMSVDYWNFNYTDLIAQSEGAQAIVNNDCLDDGIPNDPRVIRDGSGQLRQVNTEFVNVGEVKTNGLDIAMQYTAPLGNAGELVFNGKATYVNKFNVVSTAGAAAISGVGSRNFTNNFSTMPRFKANAGMTWHNANQSANVTARYISGYKNDQSNNAPVSSYTTVDFQYSIVLDGIVGANDTSLTFGMNNVFDVDPPALIRYDGNGNLITQADNPISYIDRPAYDAFSGVDIRGRILYVNIKQAF